MMMPMTMQRFPGSWRKAHQRGAALVVGLILLLVLTVLGITGVVTAALELQMSGNTQFQDRAFQAAEFAIEQAINSSDLSTVNTMTNPKLVPATTMPAANSDVYKYKLYYDSTAGSTPVPGGGYSLGTGLEAYHFVVESEGTSARGAKDAHTQSFYILGPSGG